MPDAIGTRIALRTILLTTVAAQGLPSQDTRDTAARELRDRVLFLTHSAGFVHPVVRRVEAGKLAIAERQLTAAAAPHFEVVATQDCAMLAPESLEGFDAVVFYTTGELPIPAEHATHLVEWVRAGGAFVGVHSASDTFYAVPGYGELIGGYFDGHPWHQEVAVKVEQPTHPIVAHLEDGFRIRDEIYQFRDWSRDDKTVLLRLDPASVEIERGKRDDGDYALAWCRDFGAGRMYYNALGHRPEVWADPRFVRSLLQGIRWTLDAADRLRRPPTGATVLIGGGLDANALDDASWRRHWTSDRGSEAGWKIVDDGLEVAPGSGSIVTRQSYGNFRLHIEFRIPAEDGEPGQGKGNSGVYIQRRYELQILDSHGQEPAANGCGSLYRQRAPDVNVCKAPGVWQSYDIDFREPQWNDAGEKTANARITVWHDGVLIHDDVELIGKTGAGRTEGPEPGPILLQDHGNPVRFRNVWIRPLDG